MKKTLPASRILSNIEELKGFTTKRQLARFFGVCPSSITDWVNRKGDRIPARRLAEACRDHGLRWQWVAYGEAPPYEQQHVDRSTGMELGPEELELLEKLKASPAFKRAVDQLLAMGDEQVRLLAKVAESMSSPPQPPSEDGPDRPFVRWSTRFPLTNPR